MTRESMIRERAECAATVYTAAETIRREGDPSGRVRDRMVAANERFIELSRLLRDVA